MCNKKVSKIKKAKCKKATYKHTFIHTYIHTDRHTIYIHTTNNNQKYFRGHPFIKRKYKDVGRQSVLSTCPAHKRRFIFTELHIFNFQG